MLGVVILFVAILRNIYIHSVGGGVQDSSTRGGKYCVKTNAVKEHASNR